MSRTRTIRLPSAEYLRMLLSYDRHTGMLTWISRRPRVVVGSVAGWVHSNGRRYIEIDGVAYMAHRVIWKMMTGNDPNPEVDHINLIRDDNRWSNLREASWSHNAQNRSMRSDSLNPYKGIRCDKRMPEGTRRWHARIQIAPGKRIEIGCFSTPEEAHTAYVAAAKKYHGEFARTA